MKQNQFIQHIENTRDCDPVLLDAAVRKGLLRSKREVPDLRKLISFAALCAAAAVLCIAINSEPVQIAASGFMQNNNLMTQSGSEALADYFDGITNTVTTYLGGK